MDGSTVAAFLAVSLALNLTPGADMAFVAAHAVGHGARAGRMAALGIALGSLLQALLAVAGISALVAASGELLDVLAVAGAGYLAWIGIGILRAPRAVGESGRGAGGRPFVQGVVTNLLNVKVVLFYVMLLPLLARDDAGPEWRQVLLYGLAFNALGTAVLLTVASLAARAAALLAERPRVLVRLSRIAGAVLVVLAAAVAGERLVA